MKHPSCGLYRVQPEGTTSSNIAIVPVGSVIGSPAVSERITRNCRYGGILLADGTVGLSECVCATSATAAPAKFSELAPALVSTEVSAVCVCVVEPKLVLVAYVDDPIINAWKKSPLPQEIHVHPAGVEVLLSQNTIMFPTASEAICHCRTSEKEYPALSGRRMRAGPRRYRYGEISGASKV